MGGAMFVVLSCHLVLKMYLRHFLMNVCSIRVVVLVSWLLSVSQSHIAARFSRWC